MKTYEENGYRYFYDTRIKMWTLYKIDSEGNQLNNADYHATKERLIKNYPKLKFKQHK